MLEICLPVSGLASISLIGTLTALRERKIIPDVFTGVSGGAWAAMAVLGKCYQDGHSVHFSKLVRNHLLSRPISRFLPPYAKCGIPNHLLKYSMAHSSDPNYIKRIGVKHFYVGHTDLPSMRFTETDVLTLGSRKEIFHHIWRSSSIPFVTHHGLHSHGGLDGAFRKLVFPSSHDVQERWLISNSVWPLKMMINRKKFDRIIHVKSKVKLPFLATNRQIDHSYESGYEFGLKLSA